MQALSYFLFEDILTSFSYNTQIFDNKVNIFLNIKIKQGEILDFINFIILLILNNNVT